jgi:phosphate-transporting ATPase
LQDPAAVLTVRDVAGEHFGPVSFDLADGECLAVTGPSGAGKSLLLRAVADLDLCTGAVALDGKARESFWAPNWRRRVTYLATEPGWWAETVGAHFSDWPAAAALVERMGLPVSCATWEISRLSTGERQRLGLVRALMLRPRVLLLDEITSGLDANATAIAEELVGEFLHQDNGGAVWVTHRRDQIKRIATRRVALESGRIAEAAG